MSQYPSGKHKIVKMILVLIIIRKLPDNVATEKMNH